VKGVETLLRAAASAPGDFDLRIAGDGDLRPELERDVAASGRQNVRFLGKVPPEQMGEVIRGASCVVVPSEWYENAPMSILEAFAYGKPVIAARIGGIPELVTDGVTGLLFEPGNAQDLRRAIDRLISSPGLAIEMGRRAREDVEARFGPERHYEGLMAIYERARERLLAHR
jgi:glycosyltransferase involved in cell wall biosynthesis